MQVKLKKHSTEYGYNEYENISKRLDEFEDNLYDDEDNNSKDNNESDVIFGDLFDNSGITLSIIVTAIFLTVLFCLLLARPSEQSVTENETKTFYVTVTEVQENGYVHKYTLADSKGNTIVVSSATDQQYEVGQDIEVLAQYNYWSNTVTFTENNNKHSWKYSKSIDNT